MLTAAACHKEVPDQNGASVDVPFPYSSYIFFNTSQATKGELIYDDLVDRSFAVTAYRYGGEWGIVNKGECEPNLFWNFPVHYVNGAHTYDASTHVLNDYKDSNQNKLSLIPWEDNMRYTFYAHYPYDENNVNPSVSPMTGWHGEPYIDFTLPDTPDKMFDLMTAGLQDEDNSVDNYVSLRMYHRLSAFDLFVSNNIQKMQVDGVDKEISVKIKNVSVTFNNLLYSKASFWMNRQYRPDPENYRAGYRSLTKFNNGTLKTYVILGNTEDKEIENGDRDNVTGELGRSLLIIPQRLDDSGKYLNGVVNFDCEFLDQDGEPIDIPLLVEDGDDFNTITVSELTGQSMPFNVNKNVDAGYSYYLELAFINGVITLRVASAPTWDENFNMDLEFN